MVRSKAVLGMCLLIAISPASGVVAQGFDGKAQPAELPPLSYSGSQYIDSRGCAYTRAGIDGALTWVPRMSAKREVQCGFAPSLALATAKPAAKPVAPTVMPAAKVVVAPSAVPVAVPASAPVAKPVIRAAAAPVPAAIAPRAAAPKRAAAVRVARPVQRRPQPQVVRVAATPVQAAQVPVITIAPDRLAGPVHVPNGYRPAWSDGRLNPHRGKQTLDGALQTALVWTQTVPRRLVNQLGHDVTRTYNYLIYPYTDYHKQKADLAGGRKLVVQTRTGRMVVDRSRVRVSSKSGKIILDGGLD
ncbi:hypothetical protein LCGC14_2248570 [marine sediment metagenome]|uniref:Uncharacterized protein n=1 Tax=marine sediment metagenome TaxID=412755 RepID=A0A0F9FY84_9ZZZZ